MFQVNHDVWLSSSTFWTYQTNHLFTIMVHESSLQHVPKMDLTKAQMHIRSYEKK